MGIVSILQGEKVLEIGWPIMWINNTTIRLEMVTLANYCFFQHNLKRQKKRNL